jgi:hypothetical protein
VSYILGHWTVRSCSVIRIEFCKCEHPEYDGKDARNGLRCDEVRCITLNITSLKYFVDVPFYGTA